MRPPESAPRAAGALRAVLAAFGALTLLFTGAFPPFANPNELSRYQAVVAAGERGTFEISRELETLGRHEDVARSNGRMYSNKAPGLSLAALPVYRILRLALSAPGRDAAAPILTLMRVLTVSSVCLLALARFGRRLLRAGRPEAAPLAVYAVAFGTPFLFYARTFFSHAWTASLLFLSWDGILATEARTSGRGIGAPLAAGFLAGLAAIAEYPAALIAALLALRSAAGRNGRSLALFLAGLAVPLAALAVYDTVCFGSPWILSSSREAYPEYRELASGGIFGFHAPSARVALAYLFHPARGILLFSPFLLWCVPGFVRWGRSRSQRADFFLCLAATLLFFAAMTAYPNWHGGWSLGSRYLLPVLFFAAFPIPRALETPLSRGVFLAAVAFSAACHFLLTATFPYFPEWVGFPVVSGSSWFLSRGWIAPTLLGTSAAVGALALVLAATAFAVPLAMAARAAAPLSPGSAVCALLGVAPLALVALRPPQASYMARLWRAGALGAYSSRDPARRELARVADAAATAEERHLANRAWSIFGTPPPGGVTPR